MLYLIHEAKMNICRCTFDVYFLIDKYCKRWTTVSYTHLDVYKRQDLHIKHGSVPRAVPGITVGHEMVGIVEEVGSAVTHVKPGDRVTVNVEDRKSTRLNSSHITRSRMPSSA